MFNFIKRLKFLLKRKNKKYSSNIQHNVTDIEILDTNNYSDTLYNIVCSNSNIICDVNSRTLDFEKQIRTIIDYISDNNQELLEFTNIIYRIYLNEITEEYLKFINFLNINKIHYYLDNNIITVSLSCRQLELLYDKNFINEYLYKLRSQFVDQFDYRLYSQKSKLCFPFSSVDFYHEKFVENKSLMLLPLYDEKDTEHKRHVYVIENQLLNFINTEFINNGLDFNTVSEDSILNTFIIVICIDNFDYELQKRIEKYSIQSLDSIVDCTNPSYNRFIHSFYMIDLLQLITEFKNIRSEDEQILYNFFFNTYTQCITELKEKYNHNIQVTDYISSIKSDDAENDDILEDIDEVV